MIRKIPPEAFNFYVGLGVDRSYQAVAKHYGVSKVAVTKRATKEKWQARLREVEQQAREELNKKAVEALEAVKARQLKAARFVQSRALEVVKNVPGEKGLKAVAALHIAWKHELVLLGEASERTEVSIEEITKNEIRELLVVDDGDDSEAETG